MTTVAARRECVRQLQAFAGRTMQDWAARNGVELRFIQPGKPVQNAYIESFNSRFGMNACRSRLVRQPEPHA